MLVVNDEAGTQFSFPFGSQANPSETGVFYLQFCEGGTVFLFHFKETNDLNQYAPALDFVQIL